MFKHNRDVRELRRRIEGSLLASAKLPTTGHDKLGCCSRCLLGRLSHPIGEQNLLFYSAGIPMSIGMWQGSGHDGPRIQTSVRYAFAAAEESCPGWKMPASVL